MLTKEVLINSLRPYCGVIMEYDRRNGRICVHWGGELAAGVRQRWLLPEELRDAIRSSGITSQETAVWSRYLNAAYLRKFFERGAESESFRMEFQGNDRRMRQYDIRVEKLDGDSLLISGRVAREDGVDALTASIGGVMARDETVADAVLRADRLMYRAKQRKDCVILEGQTPDDSAPEEQAPLLLVVDDAPLNRELLMAMLGDGYRYLEASDGAACLELLEQYGTGIELVLLDMVMPGMDGIRVLEEMNRRHYIEDIPVVMITADDSGKGIRQAYELGVADYISRPFDAQVVYRRVTNTVRLYARQRRLSAMLARRTQWQRRREQVMIDVLGRIVGFRSGESAEHVRHVNQLTAQLLDRLTEVSSAYRLTQAQCVTISAAAALHDVGKIGVDQSILNKPGRLTPEEFEAVKLHTVIGEELLRGMREYRGEELLETAAEICRWHHERYDGGGYPDGLKGDDIPIAAQVVSLADVYDALVSRRVYKEAYTPERAMEMIREGQCGVFNPLLVQCLTDIQDALRTEVYAGGPAS